jgi:uncharacterized protein YeaO (DUF488 family)
VFQALYRREPKPKDDQLAVLKEKIVPGTVTLRCGAKDEEHKKALVLQAQLRAT